VLSVTLVLATRMHTEVYRSEVSSLSEVCRRRSSSVSLLLCEYGQVELMGLEQNVYGPT
jgi:hypothetical protein